MDELKIIVKGLDRILFVVEQILENQEADNYAPIPAMHRAEKCVICGYHHIISHPCPDSFYAPPKKTHKDITEEGKRAKNWNRRSKEMTDEIHE
jgi:hypothetical protein